MIARPNPGTRTRSPPSPSKKCLSNTKRCLKHKTCEIQHFMYKTFYGRVEGDTWEDPSKGWIYHGEAHFQKGDAGFSSFI